MKSQILELRHFHTQNRFEVTSFLEQEKNQFNSILDAVQERIQFQASLMKSSEHEQTVAKLDDLECRDVHITTDTGLVPQVCDHLYAWYSLIILSFLFTDVFLP